MDIPSIYSQIITHLSESGWDEQQISNAVEACFKERNLIGNPDYLCEKELSFLPKSTDLSTNTDYFKESHLSQVASFYYSFGMNIAPIFGDGKYEYKHKRFGINIDEFYERRQHINEVLSYDWNKATGIGLITGFNQYRAIDIDDIVTYGRIKKIELLKFILRSLDLPEDYSWAVESGSRNGYHIIFECDDLSSMSLPNYPFAYNNCFHNDDGYVNCSRIELSWKFFLDLPPTKPLIKDNELPRYYKFVFCNRPNYKPIHVSGDVLHSTLLKLSGTVKSYPFRTHLKGKDESFSLYSNECCISASDSTGKYIKTIDPSKYKGLINQTDEGKNTIAVHQLVSNFEESIKLMQESKTNYAKLNISILKSLGLIDGSIQEIESELLNLQLKNIITEDKKNEIIGMAQNFTEPSERLIFFDTETNSLPSSYDWSIHNIKNWPRLLQLSWIISETDNTFIKKKSYYIKPVDFEISQESLAFHGISQDKAMKEGRLLRDVLDEFLADLKTCNAIVGHNIDFDKRVLGAELVRNGYGDFMENLPAYCTMKMSTDYCKLPCEKHGHGHSRKNNVFVAQRSSQQYKWPKLAELYRILFNKEIPKAHDAASDAQSTLKCFFELKRRGVINYQTNHTLISSIIDESLRKEKKNDEHLWSKCTSLNACNEYIRKCPYGKHLSDVYKKIEEFEFQNCYTEVQYLSFVKKHPNSVYKQIALNKADNLCWINAHGRYKRMLYAKKYKDGLHYSKAKNLISRQNFLIVCLTVIISIILTHLIFMIFTMNSEGCDLITASYECFWLWYFLWWIPLLLVGLVSWIDKKILIHKGLNPDIFGLIK